MDPKAKNRLLKAFYNAIPLADATRWSDPLDRAKYVEGLHSRDGRDPIEELATSINFNESGTSYLFTGHRGSGKTIELKRLTQKLEEDGCVALYVDMSDYISETEPLGIGDLLTALMGALSEAFNARYRDSPLEESYWERFKHFMDSKVELPEAKLSVGVPSFFSKEKLASLDVKLALKTNPSFKDQIKTALETSLEHFVKDARVFVDEVVEIVRKRESDPARKVVLIADSLEKIRGSGPQADVIYASIHETFHGNVAKLRFNMLHVVFSVPPTLPLIAPGVGTLYSGGLCGLPQVKVETTPSKAMKKRERFGTGLAMMVELLTRRFPLWDEVFNREQLNRLAYASGGNIRIFFSLIQRVLLKAPRVELPLKDDNLVGHAENDVRAEMLLTDEDKKWLRRVATTHESGLDRLENLGTLGRLCDNHLILDYRNGEPWYDVLPLIRDSLPKDTAP